MRWGWIPALAALAACGGDSGTGLVLVFEADEILRVGGEGFDVVIASERDGDDVPIERSRFMLGAAELPHRVGVVPVAGEPLPATVIVRYSDRAGRCAMLDGPDGCTGFECRLPMEAGRAPVHRLRLRGCPVDAGPPDAPPGDGGGCIPPSCDDGVDCTRDSCTSGTCGHAAEDSLCTEGPDGRCDPTAGCQYSVCTVETCRPGPCQTAVCEGAMCMRSSACVTGEICCGGSCLAGCDDGNPCTDDSCSGAGGCVHNPNGAACDDGMFCSGADGCGGGTCSVHAGTPCSGMAMCDEGADRCTGCTGDVDCGPPTVGMWGACGGFADGCDESGTQTRTVTTYRCSGGTCTGTDTVETQGCPRETDGTACGMTTCTGWSCGGFDDTCDQTGTETRTCTDQLCAGGSCTGVMRGESRSCSRSTGGTSCGSTTCTMWSCGGFSGVCDESGTETRTCTDYACSGGGCNGSDRPESRGCSRDRTGFSCSDGNMCTTGDACSGGSCAGGMMITCNDSNPCTDDSCSPGSGCQYTNNMNICNDGDPCTVGDRCGGGSCQPGFDCFCDGSCCVPACCGVMGCI